MDMIRNRTYRESKNKSNPNHYWGMSAQMVFHVKRMEENILWPGKCFKRGQDRKEGEGSVAIWLQEVKCTVKRDIKWDQTKEARKNTNILSDTNK